MKAIEWIKATTIAQKAIMAIGTVALVGVVGVGIFNLYNQADKKVLPTEAKKVEVPKIETQTPQIAPAAAPVPASSVVVDQPAWDGDMSNVVESNADTGEVTNTQEDYYIGDEGGRYESPQVEDGNWAEEPSYDGGYYEEPASGGGYEEPASPPPTSGGDTGGGSTEGDWDGNFGGDYAWDSSGGTDNGYGEGTNN